MLCSVGVGEEPPWIGGMGVVVVLLLGGPGGMTVSGPVVVPNSGRGPPGVGCPGEWDPPGWVGARGALEGGVALVCVLPRWVLLGAPGE